MDASLFADDLPHPPPPPAVDGSLFEEAPSPPPAAPLPVIPAAKPDPVIPAAEVLSPPGPPGRSTVMMARVELGPEMTKAAEMLFAQLASSIAWFKTQLDLTELHISKVLIAGGGAGLEALDHYLSRRFAVPVQLLDPFRGLQGQAPEHGHEYATAVGLALAAPGGHPGAIRLELLPEGLLHQRLWLSTLIWPFIAAAAVLAAGIITAWTWWAEQDAASRVKARVDRFTHDRDARLAQITQLKQEREDLGEDLRAIASRIYAARDLLFTVRALKEQTDKSRELWVTHLETQNVGKDTSASAAPTATAPPLRSPPRNLTNDTAIERGGAVISGFVQFDAGKKDAEMNDFFDKWREAILLWQPDAQAPKLFKDRHVTVFDVHHDPTGKDGTITGKVPFSVSYIYQATQLGQITIQGDDPPAAPATPAPPGAP